MLRLLVWQAIKDNQKEAKLARKRKDNWVKAWEKQVRQLQHSSQMPADATCALSGSISGAGKSIEIRLRMCGPPLFQLYVLVA